jgi:hypothetical protein
MMAPLLKIAYLTFQFSSIPHPLFCDRILSKLEWYSVRICIYRRVPGTTDYSQSFSLHSHNIQMFTSVVPSKRGPELLRQLTPFTLTMSEVSYGKPKFNELQLTTYSTGSSIQHIKHCGRVVSSIASCSEDLEFDSWSRVRIFREFCGFLWVTDYWKSILQFVSISLSSKLIKKLFCNRPYRKIWNKSLSDRKKCDTKCKITNLQY